MNKIAIVGGNEMGKTAMYAALQERGLNDVKIITVDEAQEMLESTSFNPKNEPYIIHNHRMIEPYMPNQKEFICKGKHQYKEVNGNWVCQCGRKTTD